MSDDVRKELEFAIHREDRNKFEQILELTGIFQCTERNWLIIELQNCVNNIVMSIRLHVEKKGELSQLMAVDNYFNSFLETIDRLIFSDLRELFSQLLDESFSTTGDEAGEQGDRKSVV